MDAVWGSARPPAPHPPIRVQLLQFAGASVESKLSSAREKMKEQGVGLFVVAALDEVRA